VRRPGGWRKHAGTVQYGAGVTLDGIKGRAHNGHLRRSRPARAGKRLRSDAGSYDHDLISICGEAWKSGLCEEAFKLEVAWRFDSWLEQHFVLRIEGQPTWKWRLTIKNNPEVSVRTGQSYRRAFGHLNRTWSPY
jgi:hypothetical protein